MNVNFYLTAPIAPIGESSRENFSRDRKEKKATVCKIKKLVLEDIDLVLAGSRGALLSSSAPPQVVIDMLSSIGIPLGGEEQKNKKLLYLDRFSDSQQAGFRRNRSFKYIPIGLRGCDCLPWMNSLMQFILFLAGSDELFAFIPRRFSSFRRFADQYFLDSQANRPVASVVADDLILCLKEKLPFPFFQKDRHFDFYKIFKAVVQLVFSSVNGLDPMVVKGSFFCCNKHIVLDSEERSSLEEIIYKRGCPEELLVNFHPGTASCCRLVSKQCFIQQEFLCYDLDAFIELRPEEGHNAHFIAYLKIGGVWYQCDDERISLLRSNSLNAALYQSVLLRYSRLK